MDRLVCDLECKNRVIILNGCPQTLLFVYGTCFVCLNSTSSTVQYLRNETIFTNEKRQAVDGLGSDCNPIEASCLTLVLYRDIRNVEFYEVAALGVSRSPIPLALLLITEQNVRSKPSHAAPYGVLASSSSSPEMFVSDQAAEVRPGGQRET